MPKYRLRCDIKEASGCQTYLVEASSEAEALAKWETGDIECESEEIEVTSLEEPEVESYE